MISKTLESPQMQNSLHPEAFRLHINQLLHQTTFAVHAR